MKYHILYVDDEVENLRAFKSVFRREYDIYTTESAKQGLEYLREHEVHLIITDQRMSEMSGVEFLKQVLDILPHPAPGRMILSGYSRTNEIDEAKKSYHLSEYVSKPWDPYDLRMLIDKVISNSYAQIL